MPTSDPRIIEVLNDVLRSELSAINQFFVHAEMFGDWDFQRLHEAEKGHAVDEMRHAKIVMARILFLEGKPSVGQLNRITIGENVLAALESDKTLQSSALLRLNDSIAVCYELGDHGSRVILERLLASDEEHLDWVEAQLTQIEQAGLENYLAAQV